MLLWNGSNGIVYACNIDMKLSEVLISEEYQIEISSLWASVASYENIASRDVRS
jgi:hypothetical protein